MKLRTTDPDPAPCPAPGISRRRLLAGIPGAAWGLAGAGSANKLLAASKATHMNITVGELKTWRTVKGIEGLEAGLGFLEKTDLGALSPGRHEIDGDSVYATVSRSPSRAPETGQFESHRKYIDIQYVVAGAELIGVAPVGQLTAACPYNEAKDFTLYASPRSFENIEMHPGRFVVFFPEDGHLPLCHLNGAHEIHKVVVKVRLDHWKARRKQ